LIQVSTTTVSQIQQIATCKDDAWLIALVLLLYPLNVFYYWLYYTDTGSTLAIVGVYWLSLPAHQSSTADPTAVKSMNIIATHLKQVIIFLVSSGQSNSFLLSNYLLLLFPTSFADGYDVASYGHYICVVCMHHVNTGIRWRASRC
jgi:hypothetical protein